MESSTGSDAAAAVVAAVGSGSPPESLDAARAEPDGTGAVFSPFASIGMVAPQHGVVPSIAAPGDWVTSLAATVFGFACVGVLLRRLVS